MDPLWIQKEFEDPRDGKKGLDRHTWSIVATFLTFVILPEVIRKEIGIDPNLFFFLWFGLEIFIIVLAYVVGGLAFEYWHGSRAVYDSTKAEIAVRIAAICAGVVIGLFVLMILQALVAAAIYFGQI